MSDKGSGAMVDKILLTLQFTQHIVRKNIKICAIY